MKKLVVITALMLMSGTAFAQNTGAPANQQNEMNKPGNMEKGSMGTSGSIGTSGSMGTSGMASDNKGNPKKEMSKDGSPAAGSKDSMKK